MKLPPWIATSSGFPVLVKPPLRMSAWGVPSVTKLVLNGAVAETTLSK